MFDCDGYDWIECSWIWSISLFPFLNYHKRWTFFLSDLNFPLYFHSKQSSVLGFFPSTPISISLWNLAAILEKLYNMLNNWYVHCTCLRKWVWNLPTLLDLLPSPHAKLLVVEFNNSVRHSFGLLHFVYEPYLIYYVYVYIYIYIYVLNHSNIP